MGCTMFMQRDVHYANIIRMNLRKRTYIFCMDLIKGGNIMKNPYTQNDFDLGDIDIESAPILTDISIGICS